MLGLVSTIDAQLAVGDDLTRRFAEATVAMVELRVEANAFVAIVAWRSADAI